jgi:hypothetical protein
MKFIFKILFGVFILALILSQILPGLLGGSSTSATGGCPSGQELVLLPPDETAKCLPICEPGFKRCGEQCQNSDIYGCTTNSSPCTIERLCTNNTVCCADDKLCDPETDKCSASCPNVICGGKCCPNSTDQCLNGTTCCDPAKSGKNSSGQDVCCPNELCNGVCCTGTGVECNNGKCMTKCGDKFCDPDSEICGQVVGSDGSTSYFCKTKGCEWNTISYDPGNVGNDDVEVCKNRLEPNKLYVAKNPSGFSGTLERTVRNTQSDTSRAQCNFNDCAARLAEKGLINAKFDSGTKTCTGNFSCDINLPSLDSVKTDFGNTSSKINAIPELSRCRDGSNQYTGQICPGSQRCVKGKGFCLCGNSEQNGYLGCTNGRDLCNQHGVITDSQTGKCVCDSGYYGSTCALTSANTCDSRGIPNDDGSCNCGIPYAGYWTKCNTLVQMRDLYPSENTNSIISDSSKFLKTFGVWRVLVIPHIGVTVNNWTVIDGRDENQPGQMFATSISYAANNSYSSGGYYLFGTYLTQYQINVDINVTSITGNTRTIYVRYTKDTGEFSNSSGTTTGDNIRTWTGEVANSNTISGGDRAGVIVIGNT